MKNIHIFFYLAILSLTTVLSDTAFAGKVESRIIELQCGPDLDNTPEFIQKGDPYTTLSVETIGIIEKGIEGVIDVIAVPAGKIKKETMKAGSKLLVWIDANCTPKGEVGGISHSGGTLVCQKGQGLNIQLCKPKCTDPNQFHAVLRLTEVIDDEPIKVEEKQSPKKDIKQVVESEIKVPLTRWDIYKQDPNIERKIRNDLWLKGYSDKEIHLALAKFRVKLRDEKIEEIKRVGRESFDRYYERKKQIQELLEKDVEPIPLQKLLESNNKGKTINFDEKLPDRILDKDKPGSSTGLDVLTGLGMFLGSGSKM